MQHFSKEVTLFNSTYNDSFTYVYLLNMEEKTHRDDIAIFSRRHFEVDVNSNPPGG